MMMPSPQPNQQVMVRDRNAWIRSHNGDHWVHFYREDQRNYIYEDVYNEYRVIGCESQSVWVQPAIRREFASIQDAFSWVNF